MEQGVGGGAMWGACASALRLAAYSTLLPELRQLDRQTVAPAADLHRRLAHRAADGADVAAVLAEKLAQELTQRLILGQQGRGGGGPALVRADGFGEVLEVDLAGVGQGDGGEQRLLELADVGGPGIADRAWAAERCSVMRSGSGATRGKIAAVSVPRSSRRSRSAGSIISKPARRA